MSGVGLHDILLPSDYKLTLLKGNSFKDPEKVKNLSVEYLKEMDKFFDIPRTINDLLNTKYIEDWEWMHDEKYLYQLDFFTLDPYYYVKLDIKDIPLECFNTKSGWHRIKEKMLLNKEGNKHETS